MFTRAWYKDLIVDSLNHCIKEKGLIVHAWVIMSNHLHLIAKSNNNDLSGTLRDFKKFTSKKIIKTIEEKSESRKEWLLQMFLNSNKNNMRKAHYKLWKRGNCPIELIKTPVEARFVYEAHHYPWSSAIDYSSTQKGMVNIEMIS